MAKNVGPMELNPQQDRFCRAYFETGKAAQSAASAGYSRKSAHQMATALLRWTAVRARLADLRQKAEDASVSTGKERRQVLTKIERATLGDFLDGSGEIRVTAELAKHPAIAEFVTRTWYPPRGGRVVERTLKLRDPMIAIAEHNRMDRVYDAAPQVNVDNRNVNVIVQTEHARALVERVLLGERTGPEGDAPRQAPDEGGDR